ncbi:MAG: glycosyltransferase family 39 protein [Acidobacteria bacterium]|nr:glycosyltransferase family 39 protein [Acidobacteriota bacterium]
MSRRGGAAILLAIVVIAGGAYRLVPAAHHARVDYDEGRYLDDAAHILRGDGFLTSTVSLYFGDPPRPPRPEDFSSPLYPYLLAAIFAVTGLSFTLAKLLSVALAVLTIPLVYLLGRRLFGPAEGLLAAAAFAFQPDQVIVSSWAMTESIYTFLIVAFACLAAPLARRAAKPLPSPFAVALGALCGALYLVRQNGAVALAVALALLAFGPVAAGEGRGRRAALAGLLALTAAIVCAPWFARNVSVFGSPAYSRMKNVAWAPSGRSLYTPGEPAPSMQRFIEQHGAAGVAREGWRRATRVTRALLLGEDGPFRWMTILAFAAPFIPLARAGSAVALPPAILSAGMFLGVAPWSGALPRYFLPVRPLLYAAGAAAIVAAFRRLGLVPSRARGRVAAAIAIAVSLVWGGVVSRPVLGRYLDVDQEPAHRAAIEASRWIDLHTQADDVLLEGGLLHQYAWLHGRGVVWIPDGDLAALRSVASHYRAGFVALTPEALRFRPSLARYWEVAGRSIHPLEVPPGLTLAYDRRDDGVLIYSVDEAGRP